MTLPGQSIRRREGGLGIVESAPDKFLYVGGSSSGTVNTIETFASPQKVRDTLGEGSVVDAACHKLDVAGGSVDILKTATSVAAANSAVAQSGAGPLLAVAGAARNFYQFIAQVMLGGTLGNGRFRRSEEHT